MKKSLIIFTILFLSIFSKAQNFRDSVDVLHYSINLEIDNFRKKSISGNTTLTLLPIFNQTKIIKLDLLNFDISKITINGKKSKNWTYKNNIISIPLKKNINIQDTTKIQVFYSGKPEEDDSWGGFYFSHIDAFNMGVGMSAVPHSFGRAWYPCIDRFTDKATYEYYITTSKPNKVACGGLLVDTQLLKDDKITYHWKQNEPIPTYLSSVAVSDYDTISWTYKGIERDIPIEVFTYNGKKPYTKKSLVNLQKAMKIFETLFGAYQFEKIGYSEVSFSAGAMEHAGNISVTKYAFDGSLRGETLLYHELSHSWFGDLVTCKTAGDMWLNEGWASYCESIFLENMYGKQRFRDYNRNRHLEVLHFAHQYDHGYKSLANMDLDHTYGKTVYDKGADIVHSLRYYLGDSVFFPAVRYYLEKYKFSNASSEDLRDALSEYSKVDLTDFFDFWVFGKGFPFFEIDNYTVTPNGDKFNVDVKVSQRLIGGDVLAKSNRLEIFFMDSNFNTQKRILEFSGASGEQQFSLPFKPKLVMLDIYEHVTDATIDKYFFATDTGEVIFDESLFDANITNITDTAFIRATCNNIEPDHDNLTEYLVQKKYYWTIEGLWNDDFKAEGKFYVTTLMDFNFTKLYKPKDFVLIYRKNKTEQWHETDFTNHDDYLSTDLRTGQYAIAIKK